MTIKVEVSNTARRALVAFSAICVCALLLVAALANCIVGLLSDPRADASRELLVAGTSVVPNSAPLNAKLAEIEMSDEDRDMLGVERRARQAVNASPWDYRHRLLLATVKEAAGSRAEAEQALQEALALAPNYTEVHWRFANLLLRQGKLARSVVEFRAANSSNPALLPGTIDLLWRVSSGSLATVQAVTPRDPKSQLSLAQFLLAKSRASDAITVCSGIDRNVLIDEPGLATFINTLVATGHFEEARGLWIGVVGGTYAQPGQRLPGLWNGSFEADSANNLAQFDWAVSRNEFAVPAIDSSIARTGARSLRIDFTGRDTTRLDGQVKQTIVVVPGARYRLECYIRTERLESPEGPRIVVADMSSGAEIATSDPISQGSGDWRLTTVDFKAPDNARAAIITIKRVPKFSFDKPTRGTIWLDDFVLTGLSK